MEQRSAVPPDDQAHDSETHHPSDPTDEVTGKESPPDRRVVPLVQELAEYVVAVPPMAHRIENEGRSDDHHCPGARTRPRPPVGRFTIR